MASGRVPKTNKVRTDLDVATRLLTNSATLARPCFSPRGDVCIIPAVNKWIGAPVGLNYIHLK